MATKQKSTGGNDLYSTDRAVISIYSNLLRDFRKTEGNDFMAGPERAFLTDIKTFRALPERELGDVSVGRFKRTKQMESLLKKYRFRTDAFTDDELSTRTLNKFLEEQVRLHDPMAIRPSGFRVLQRARLIARRILGDFPGDEVVNYVRFGKKSSIGCPLSLAYIDIKLSNTRAMTGTVSASEFFLNQVLPGDHVLQRICKAFDFGAIKEQLKLNYLNLVEVPKTWKSYRLITPLTLLGLFYSYGLGRIITSRLKDAGLDIRRLQHVHRELVKGFSRTRSHATADLSAASDSITSELLNRILPRPWYVALRKTFVRNLRVNDSCFSTASVLPMGNGATFPTETLVFYCIIKAIGELTNIGGIYSVYGDDLIYPSRLHSYVTAIFPQLHLKLNLDKTFVRYPFRESCGSDYYRGADVRPCFIKGEAQNLTRVRYQAFLYKVYNGLTARWDPLEIRETLSWLLAELCMTSHTILRVPPSFPDYSGVKVMSHTEIPLSYNHLPFSPISYRFRNGSSWFQFDYLTETARKRVVKTTEPYYWLALQGLDDDTSSNEFDRDQQRFDGTLSNSAAAKLAMSALPIGRMSSERPRSALSWIKTHVTTKVFWKAKRKIVKKLYKFDAVVPARKGSTVSTATTKTDTVSDWI